MLRKAQEYPRSNPRRQHSVCLHVLPRQRCCEQYEESIDDFALVLEGTTAYLRGAEREGVMTEATRTSVVTRNACIAKVHKRDWLELGRLSVER